MTHPIIAPRKLIEVALPLNAINAAAAREKSIRQGHPSTLHLYWARRPLAAARAVIFSQMVNDPSWKWELEHPNDVPPNHLKATWAKSRQRLFKIIEELVTWENTTNRDVIERARAEIRKSWRETCELNKAHPLAAELFDPDRLPAFHDPFAGGGSIPLEAQRLGLMANASDLNPVAVLINKAMLEIPTRFTARPPVNPLHRKEISLVEHEWKGARGLAEDIRYYGKWLRDEAEKRVGHLYPKVAITAAMLKERPDLKPYVGQQLTVIAWLWARTVRSPNPAFANVDVPLVSTFMLSAKEEKEAYVEPIVDEEGYRFVVKVGLPKHAEKAKNGTKLGRGANFQCLMSGTAIAPDYIYVEAKAGRMGARLMAVVAEGDRGRVFLEPTADMETAAGQARPAWRPDVLMPENPRWFSPPLYGLKAYGDLFTPRQLDALTTFSDLVQEVGAVVERDAHAAGMSGDGTPLRRGGMGALAYAEAMAVYLAFASDKAAEGSTTICTWSPLPSKLHVVSTFGRQAIPMTWDFAESNVFADSSGNIQRMCELTASVIERSCSIEGALPGEVHQADATHLAMSPSVVSTDPPYYDNIGYADLSDFFYVWLRRSLRSVFPELLATIAVPKQEELVATPYRHSSKAAAERFFLEGMTQVMHKIAEQAHPAFPVSIYYAFKQSESEGDLGTASTGWDTFLDAVIRAGLAIGGTWPVRTERAGGFRNNAQNALASSIVLVCRPRAADALTISRRQFVAELRTVLPEALDDMTRGADEWGAPVAPVDLSQAIIGPGMEVFTRYAAVLEADGTPMSVRTALRLINRFLADDDFDADTQFCTAWFEQFGWKSGPFGVADTLARAKGTSVEGVKNAGVVHSAGGSVRLTRPTEYPDDWDPAVDIRMPVWEVLHHLIRALRADGEQGAAALLGAVQSRAEAARQLAYRLYTLCERAGWAEEARAYNELIASWTAIESATPQSAGAMQQTLFDS